MLGSALRVTKLKVVDVSKIRCFEILQLDVQRQNLRKGRYRPVVLNFSRLLVEEPDLIRVVLQLLPVRSELVLATFSHGEFVHHSISWQQIGSLAHLIRLMEQFELETVEAQGP